MELKTYYVTGNTAEGFVNLLSSNLVGVEETMTLHDHSHKERTAILNKLIEDYEDTLEMEVIKSPISEKYLDGIIFRGKKLAVLGELEQPFTDKPYELFKEGLRVHDRLESVFINEMDFDKANKKADALIDLLLQDVEKKTKTPTIYRRLFGTNTVDGVVNEVPSIMKRLKHVYHIKGRAGTGKSTFMKQVADACYQHGLDLEMYYCSFDPESIDMVLIPELKTCLFDSTDPHAFEPEDKEKERIIDLYVEAVTPGTDEKYEKEITALTKEYKGYMKQGVAVIREEGRMLMEADEKKGYSEAKVNKTLEAIQNKLK